MWYDILFSKSIFYIWISGLVVVFLMSRLAISSSLTMLTRSWFLEESKECSSLENNTFTLLFFGDVTFRSNNDFYEALLDNRLTWDILFDGDFLSFLLLALFIGEWIKGEDKSIGICCSPAINSIAISNPFFLNPWKISAYNKQNKLVSGRLNRRYTTLLF